MLDGDQPFVGQQPHCLARCVAGHVVRLDQLSLGGEPVTRCELAGLDSSAQLGRESPTGRLSLACVSFHVTTLRKVAHASRHSRDP